MAILRFLCSTSPPGGNQVDGLLPASSSDDQIKWQIYDIGGGNRAQIQIYSVCNIFVICFAILDRFPLQWAIQIWKIKLWDTFQAQG